MFALIYLGLAITLGDLLCRRFYRFVSIPHRWAAATLVGLLLSTWFTYLAELACCRSVEPLLCADLLFFAAAPVTIWFLRKAPKMQMIAPRSPRSSTLDWVTLGALFAAACVLLIGTLYVNKQGKISLFGMDAADFARHANAAQNFALGHNAPAKYPRYAGEPYHDYHSLFSVQAGNLELLGLDLAWSIDLLSVFGLTAALALVIALGELLFNSPIVGRLGATLFLFHSPLRHLANLVPYGSRQHDETWIFWKEIAFVNQRYLSFAVGMLLLVLIFLLDQYRHGRMANSAPNVYSDEPLPETKELSRSNQPFFSRPAESFVFSALLVAALPPWHAAVFIANAVMLGCLVLAYLVWCLSRMKKAVMLGRILLGILTSCILAGGVVDLLAVGRSRRIEPEYEKQPLVNGLVFRNFVRYKSLEPSPPPVATDSSLKSRVTAFEGGRGQGSGQFNNPLAIATDRAGNIFVADSGNGRIEKFAATGAFLTSIGTKGSGHGQFGEPNGLALDGNGNIYVAEASNHRVQKLAPNGAFISEWATGLYGPRRIVIGPDDSFFLVDQGNARIVKFNSDGQVLAILGSAGTGDGQFRDPTSVAVDLVNNKVYVADPIGHRIQIFDSTGRFLTKWSIPEWGEPNGFEDLAIDPKGDRLYATSAHINTIFVFDLEGNRLPPLTCNNPTALALANDKLLVFDNIASRVALIVLRKK